MRRSSAIALAALVGLLACPSSLRAQWVIGAHRVETPDAGDGSSGFGLRGGLQFGPVGAVAVVDWARPRCVAVGPCHDRSVAVHASLEVPTPVLRPYLVAGMGRRDRAPGPDELRRTTLIGFGLRFGLAGIDLFGEATGERLRDDETRLVLRAGVRF